MKKQLLTIALLALCTLASARPEGDTITQPILVVGRQFNEAGNIVAQYNLDFSYNLDGTLKEFNFPGREKTKYHYYGDSIYREETFNYQFTYWQEDYYWYYDKSGKLDWSKRIWGEDYWSNEYYYYYYDEHDRLIRKDCGYYPNHIETRWTWEYSEDEKEVTESWQTSGGRPLAQYIYFYNDIHTLLTKQETKYNNSGVINEIKLTTYSYAPSGKLEAEVTQALENEEWVNSSIIQYQYDDNERITEIQKGSWEPEQQSWRINRRRVFEYADEEMKVTITFLKMPDDQWVWDDYNGYYDQIFFDPPMNTVHQRAMRVLGESFYQVNGINDIDPVNQLEITFVYTGIPNYMDVPQTTQTDVVVYPNPGKEEVTVRANTERAVIRFYDQQGRLLVSKPFDFSTSLSTENWTPGLYIWEVWHDTQREAFGKWIKE